MKKIIIILLVCVFSSAFLFAADEIINIIADRFHLFDDKILFYSFAEINKGDFKLISRDFQILRERGEERTIEATQGVYIEFESGKATAVELTYDLQTEIGKLSKDVEANIKTKDSTETVIVICDFLDFNMALKQYSGEAESEKKKIKLYKGDLYAESMEFTFNGETQVIVLKGMVYVEDPKNRRRLNGETVTLYLDTDELDASKCVMTIITKN